MPAIPVNRATSWDLWSRGLVAATNLENPFDSDVMLASLAVKRNYNAIRLWISDNDALAIGSSSSRLGWKATAQSALFNQVNKTMDAAKQLGVGVIFVVNFFKTGDGPSLWGTVRKNAQGNPITDAAGYVQKQDSIVLNAAGNPMLDGNGVPYTYAKALQSFWTRTFNQWGAHDALIGFDLVNEPAPKDDGSAYTFAALRDDPRGWPKLAQTLIDAIRQIERDFSLSPPLPLIVEGIAWGSRIGLGIFDANNPTMGNGPYLKDAAVRANDRIVYSIHHYDPSCLTHQGVSEWNYEDMGTTYPLPGVSADAFWLNGKATYQLNPYASPADIAAGLQQVIQFKNTYKVPIFVGEFSVVNPDINQVYPVLSNPSRSTAFPNQRVSEVQNTVQWQTPTLAKIATLSDQSGVSSQAKTQTALYNWMQSAGFGGQAYGPQIVWDVYAQTGRRWITNLVVSADGTTATATLAHDGFRVNSAPLSLSQLSQYLDLSTPQTTNDSRSLGGNANLAKNFVAKPKAKLVGVFGYIDTQGVSVSTPLVGAPLDISVSQIVSLQSGTNKVVFTGNFSALQGKQFSGVQVTVPTSSSPTWVSDGKTPASMVPQNGQVITLPVAYLWLEPASTPAQVEQSRFNYARDTMSVWQANGFSWAWHASCAEGSADVLAWRASEQIAELLGAAAAGRRLAPRV